MNKEDGLRIDEVIFEPPETPNYFGMIYERTRESIKRKRYIKGWSELCAKLDQQQMIAHGPDDYVFHHHGRIVHSVRVSTLESEELWSIARLEISVDDGYYRLLRIFPEQGSCQCFMGLWMQCRESAPIMVSKTRMTDYMTKTQKETTEVLEARVKGTIADNMLEEINSRIEMLAELGFSIRIETQHLQPLSMGNYRQFAELYPNRKLYRADK